MHLGIKPTHPSTGFGYIKTENNKHNKVLDVLNFIEKPNLSTAKKFLQDDNYFWNAGIFLVSAHKIKESFLEINPVLEKSIRDVWSKREVLSNLNIIKKRDMISLQNISVDKAILENEKSKNLFLLRVIGVTSAIGFNESFTRKYNKDKSNEILAVKIQIFILRTV